MFIYWNGRWNTNMYYKVNKQIWIQWWFQIEMNIVSSLCDVSHCGGSIMVVVNPTVECITTNNYDEVCTRRLWSWWRRSRSIRSMRRRRRKKNAIDLYWESRYDLNLPEPLNGCSLKSEFLIISTEFRFLTSQHFIFSSLPYELTQWL